MRTIAGKWWRARRDRFGWAGVVGTVGAIFGFQAGYARSGSLLAAAGLATTFEVVGFCGRIALRTGQAARRVTEGSAGWDRFVAAPGTRYSPAWRRASWLTWSIACSSGRASWPERRGCSKVPPPACGLALRSGSSRPTRPGTASRRVREVPSWVRDGVARSRTSRAGVRGACAGAL